MRPWRPLSRRWFATRSRSSDHDGLSGKLKPNERTRVLYQGGRIAKKDDSRTEFERSGTVAFDGSDNLLVNEALRDLGQDLIDDPDQDETVRWRRTVGPDSKHAPVRDRKQDTQQDAEQYDDDTSNGQKDPRTGNWKHLPLPPFLREQVEAGMSNKDYSFTNHASRGNDRTIAWSFKHAPFSTAFAMNPYAHALATPAREDNFSKARLPRTCLIDFHLVQSEDEKELLLAPVTLAAQLLNKKKPLTELTSQEKNMAEIAKREDSPLQTAGGGSYVLNSYETMKWISANQRRVRLQALSRRMHQTLSEEGIRQPIKWNKDMADAVLNAMRRVVKKRLHFLFHSKTNIGRPGLLVAPSSQFGLRGLNMIDDAMCVLELRHRRPFEGHQDVSLPEAPVEDLAESRIEEEMRQFSSTQPDSTVGNAEEAMPDSDLTRMEQSDPAADSEEETISDYRPVQQPSSTYLDLNDSWTARDFKKLPLKGVNPQPPPLRPSVLHFPTVKYRTRRIPLYNLPRLLGDSVLQELLKGSAFKECDVVAITMDSSTVQVQTALLKLQAYLAGPKNKIEGG